MVLPVVSQPWRISLTFKTNNSSTFIDKPLMVRLGTCHFISNKIHFSKTCIWYELCDFNDFTLWIWNEVHKVQQGSPIIRTKVKPKVGRLETSAPILKTDTLTHSHTHTLTHRGNRCVSDLNYWISLVIVRKRKAPAVSSPCNDAITPTIANRANN